MNKLLFELRRRKVIPALIAYVVGAWVLMQITGLLADAFSAPEWLMQALLILLVVALPFVAAFAWRYDITADGIVRTEFADDATVATRVFDHRIRFITIGLLAGALSLSVYSNFKVPEKAPELVSILIADIENTTGNELFSGVLEETLRIGLEVAPFVDIFSRGRAIAIANELVEDSAEPVSLTLDFAGLVALRESVDVVVGGRVSQSAQGLVIEMTGLAPGETQALFEIKEVAASQAEILDAIAVIARKLRAELGDAERSDDAGANESFAVANLEAAAEYLKAQDLQRSRKLEEAVVHYREALKYDPEFARAYAGLALTETYLGRMDDAEANWQKALSRLDTVTERGQLRTLGVYYTIFQRDYSKALETFERLVERFPADNVAQNNLAVAAFYTMDFARATEVGRQVAERFPDHSGYGANLALYAMYASNFDEASSVAGKVLQGDQNNVYAHIVKALTAAVEQDYDAAAETYGDMGKLDEFGQSVAPEGLADLALYQRRFDEASSILRIALADDSGIASGHSGALKQVMLAEALIGLSDTDAATAAIELALESANGDPAVLVPAALMLAGMDDTDGATTIANELGGRLSKSPQAYSAVIAAYVAAINGDANTATELADKALVARDLWLVRLVRADVFARTGQTEKALQEIDECLERPGEGIAVFLNDRPSLRMLRRLDELSETI